MKNLLAILLSVFMLMTFIACDKDDTPEGTDTETATETETETDTTTDTETETETETEAETGLSIDGFYALFENADTKPESEFKLDVTVGMEMAVTAQGMSQTQSMAVSGALVVEDRNLSASLNLPATDPMGMVYVNGTLYLTASNVDKASCSVTVEELTAYVTELFGGMTDGSMEDIFGDADLSAVPGLQEIITTAATMKPSDFVGEATVTVDPDTGNYTLTLSGISKAGADLFQSILDLLAQPTTEGSEPTEDEMASFEMAMAMMTQLLEDWQDPEKLSFSMTYDKELRFLSMDLFAVVDVSAFLTSSGINGQCIITFTTDVTMDYGNQTVTAPTDTENYVEMTFEELMEGIMGDDDDTDTAYGYGIVDQVSYSTTNGDIKDNATILIDVYMYQEANGQKVYESVKFSLSGDVLEDALELIGWDVYFVYNTADNTIIHIEGDMNSEPRYYYGTLTEVTSDDEGYVLASIWSPELSSTFYIVVAADVVEDARALVGKNIYYAHDIVTNTIIYMEEIVYEEGIDEYGYGVLTEITYDEDGNAVAHVTDLLGNDTYYTFYLTDTALENALALVGQDVLYQFTEDTIVDIWADTVATTDPLYVVGYIASFDTAGSVLVINEVCTDDNGNEHTEPVTILVPATLADAVLAINPKTCMAFATCEYDEDGNLTLTAIEPWACSAQ